MHQPGNVKPTTLPTPSPTPPGCCYCAGPSVGLWVSPRRGSCGCTGRERLLASSLGGRLARLELESRVASWGGDEGGGWELPGPITDPRAPPQPSPPRASRLGGRRDQQRPASYARPPPLGLQIPTVPVAGPGSERGQRALPQHLSSPPPFKHHSPRSFPVPW